MANQGRRLEEITYENGRWVRISDRLPVRPRPRGYPIADLRYDDSERIRYDVARRGARKQDLWEVVNAYSAAVVQHRGVASVHTIIVAQLYVI